jgi:hypothetical protein
MADTMWTHQEWRSRVARGPGTPGYRVIRRWNDTVLEPIETVPVAGAPTAAARPGRDRAASGGDMRGDAA